MAILNQRGLNKAKVTIMSYAMSGEGKTGQIGALAEDLFLRTGKRTLLYSMDYGGWETISHLTEEGGPIDVVPLLGMPHPWEWSDQVAKGMIPSADGSWAPLSGETYGCVAFDGATGMADILIKHMADQAGIGKNPTAQSPAIKFKDGDKTINNNAPAHYGMVQQHLMACMRQSSLIPVEVVLWTALAKGGGAEDATQDLVVGPQIVGKAITAQIPQLFVYTFRLAAIPGNPGMGTHASTRLYLHPHMEGVSAGSKGLANPRGPVGEEIPDYIEPASIPEALRIIAEAKQRAQEKFALKVAAAKKEMA